MIKLLVTVSLITLFALNATDALAQNVAQVSASPGVECPVSGVVGDVPVLALSLNTLTVRGESP